MPLISVLSVTCTHTTAAELDSYEKPFGPQRLNCLLPDLLQKNLLTSVLNKRGING